MHKHIIPAALAVAFALSSGAAKAALITYDFTSGPATINLGASENYDSTPAGGPTLTAYSGYVTGVSSVTLGGVLVGNNRGADEQGLGVCIAGVNGASSNACNPGHYDDNPEIDAATRELVQLNIAPLLAGGYTSFFVNADSATQGELLAIYQSATQTGLGTFLASITSTNGDVAISPTLSYLNFIATVAQGPVGETDVLVHSISANTSTAAPEPASLAMFGTALLGLAALRRGQKRRQDA